MIRMGRLDEIARRRVVPGDDICIIEEFLPGIGTYEDNGIVKSAFIGEVSIDMNLRVISVKPKVRIPILPSRGTVVYGVVAVVKDEYAIIRIIAEANGHKYQNVFTGLLHITQASEGFVKNLYEVLRVGDLIKAKVLNDNPPYNLTIKEKKLGIVLAFCGRCGSILDKSNNDILKCPKCGNTEKRKLSMDYGKVKGILGWGR